MKSEFKIFLSNLETKIQRLTLYHTFSTLILNNNQIVVRYEIYKMSAGQKFYHFEALQSEFDKAIEDIKDKRFGQKITFFADARNAKYINWKAIPILKYYLTRFGDIKPRLYTGNSVKTQKAVRQEIIRARTLGLLNFISR